MLRIKKANEISIMVLPLEEAKTSHLFFRKYLLINTIAVIPIMLNSI